MLYNDFRTKEYDPNSQVVPWTVKLPGAVDPLATGARLFDQVPRTTNHSRTKPIGFVTTHFVSTIQSHGLEHLIDPDYVVKDAALDQLNVAGSTRFY
jgi:hypothetical protein